MNQLHRYYWPIVASKWNGLHKKRLANPLLVGFIEKILKFAKILITVARCPVKRTRAKRPCSIIETDIPHLHGSNCWRIEFSIMECHHCIKIFVHQLWRTTPNEHGVSHMSVTFENRGTSAVQRYCNCYVNTSLFQFSFSISLHYSIISTAVGMHSKKVGKTMSEYG